VMADQVADIRVVFKNNNVLLQERPGVSA